MVDRGGRFTLLRSGGPQDRNRVIDMLLDLPSLKLLGSKLASKLSSSEREHVFTTSPLWRGTENASFTRTLTRLFESFSLRPAADPQVLTPLATEAVAAAEMNSEVILGKDGPMRSAIVYCLASLSRGFMQQLNRTDVRGGQHMEAALNRPPIQALITVCNHVAAMDDPLVMSTVIPSRCDHGTLS